MAERPDVDLKLIVLGAHLSPEFGLTIQVIEKDGFAIDGRIECLLSSDTDVGMAKTIGLATLSLADLLGTMRPDLLLLIADRYEMLAPASVALALRIPVAHIEGGEISEGAIDDAVRNALTKMSHIHFTSTEKARERVISLDEEPWRVHCAGAPSLDHLTKRKLFGRVELQARLGVELQEKSLLVAYHPVTLLEDTTAEADALFAALEEVGGQVLFCYPNSDAGSRSLIARAKEFINQRGNGRGDGHIFTNLDALTYWSLLAEVEFLLGNSSSGIMETASFALPTINVGMRQKGRERAMNVIDVDPVAEEIAAAVERARGEEFRRSLAGMVNPYGDGHAAERIVEVLTSVPLGPELLIKRANGKSTGSVR
jgi:UDP-N-acetylglucosamine 2-epimerase (non-hydrolysing)/GDP/UDP-N,N'-diacetylbacillosamine 2-epimerase (hydrolysing)